MRWLARDAARLSTLVAFASLAVRAGASETPVGWQELERVRGALSRSGPLGAEFEQSFVPAGFETGDVESGDVAVGLPDCMRWDYLEPDAKSFLVCGARAWSWVEGEPRGRRATIDAENETGLDLLLLATDELARRYRLTVTSNPAGDSELAFAPIADGSQLRAANLVVARDSGLPLSLEWRDREGSVTSFLFRAWHPLPDTDLFSPPASLDWADPRDP